MMSIKRFASFVPVAALAFFVGACGDDSPADGDAGADSGTADGGGDDDDDDDDLDAAPDGSELVGISCDDAVVANDPSAQAGGLEGHANVADGTCQAGGGPDFVYEVTPQYTGVLHLSLSSVSDLGLFAHATCGDVETELGCADAEPGGAGEALDLDVEAGVPVYVFVGGYTETDVGNFTLQIISEEVVPLPDETACDDLDDNDEDGDMDCDDATACQTLPACTPGEGALGTTCTVQTECAADTNDPFCYSEANWGYPGGACSEFCSLADQDCPGDGVCVNVQLGNGHGLCFDGCAADECRDGYTCNEGLGACLPGCTDNAQCPVTGYCDTGSGYCVAAEICDNQEDDNQNYDVDCEDVQCVEFETCEPLITGACEGAITAVLGDNAGDTTEAFTAVFSSSNCTGGYGAHEHVYTFTPGVEGENGVLILGLESATDQGIYVRTSCDDPGTTLACTDQFEGGTDEHLQLDVVGGVPLTIVVDGWYNPAYAGPYVLNVAYTANPPPN